MAIDSKLRACDLVRLRVCDLIHGDQIASRAIVLQKKTKRTVQFELTDQTKQSIQKWANQEMLTENEYLFPSRLSNHSHMSTRQYARLVSRWIESIGFEKVRHSFTAKNKSFANL